MPMTARSRRTARRGLRLVGAGLVVALGGCASAATVPAVTGAAGVPGFDTRTYPGDVVMRQWKAGSPYRWVGFYLPSPCHPRSTWTGRRDTLDAMGWGFAVLYVGEQDWSAVPNPPAGPGLDPGAGVPRCTSDNLGGERGAADGEEASALAAAEGFPAGTIVYLNVERVDSISAALDGYVRAWVGAVLDGERMRPGLYAHARNAAALHATAQAEFARRQRTDRPRLWVAKAGGFDLRTLPAASGFAEANVWQGLFDVNETWAGATLRIDANVADTASPSS
jgi:hypothetical protein